MAIVQAWVGHGSPAMTRHYPHISRDAAENVIQTLPGFNENTPMLESDEKKILCKEIAEMCSLISIDSLMQIKQDLKKLLESMVS